MTIEQQAELLSNNITGWETHTLQRIGSRIKRYGDMSVAQIKQINAMADAKRDFNAIVKELAEITGQNVSQIKRIYGDLLEEQNLANKPLYDYRGKTFKKVSESRELSAIVKAFAKNSAETMLNVTATKALGFIDANGGFTGLQKSLYETLAKAASTVASGSADFDSAMRDTIIDLGGNGVRVNYGDDFTRRLDTVVRQNILYGAKQASMEYNEEIGKELECDGIEIDWHSNPRPSHEFMQGKQYALGGAKVVKGKYYASADKALERLQDYGCLHFKTPIILGVSEPRYDAKELVRMNAQNLKVLKSNGVEKTGYFWEQDMRKLETAMRQQKSIKVCAAAAGNKALVKECNDKIKLYEGRYAQICNDTGLSPEWQRTAIVRGSRPLQTKIPKPKPEYKPAETIKEAEEFINKYVDDDIFGAYGVSYTGISVDSANVINKTISQFAETYNADKFGGIIAPAGNTKRGKMISGAVAAYSPINKSFLLNRNDFKSMKIAKKAFSEEKEAIKSILEHPERYDFDRLRGSTRRIIERSKISGRATVPDNVSEAITHELGHSLENRVAKSKDWEIIKGNMNKYADKISGYAGENASEYIAESFTSYEKGENVIDPVLRKLFDSFKE